MRIACHGHIRFRTAFNNERLACFNDRPVNHTVLTDLPNGISVQIEVVGVVQTL